MTPGSVAPAARPGLARPGPRTRAASGNQVADLEPGSSCASRSKSRQVPLRMLRLTLRGSCGRGEPREPPSGRTGAVAARVVVDAAREHDRIAAFAAAGRLYQRGSAVRDRPGHGREPASGRPPASSRPGSRQDGTPADPAPRKSALRARRVAVDARPRRAGRPPPRPPAPGRPPAGPFAAPRPAAATAGASRRRRARPLELARVQLAARGDRQGGEQRSRGG